MIWMRLVLAVLMTILLFSPLTRGSPILVTPQGATAPRATIVPPAAAAKVADYVAAAGQNATATGLTATPPTVGIFVRPLPRGAKAISTIDSQGRFVIFVPPGLTVGQAAARVLHEVDHKNNNDPPLPDNPTTGDLTAYMCVEARANCEALRGMATAAANDKPFPCSVVEELQSDAYNNYRSCQLGVAVQGPVQGIPCPEVAPGEVPCTP